MDLVEGVSGAGDSAVWVFGYGSLIWRPDFPFSRQRIASVVGYQRRFCQASHDHRGTLKSPGRVVTLAPDNYSFCRGMAYALIEPVGAVLEQLDIREQDGYERKSIQIQFDDGSQASAITWIASEGNPSWRGGESLSVVADIVAHAEGPSGTNREYLYELAKVLQGLKIADRHIESLVEQVKLKSI